MEIQKAEFGDLEDILDLQYLAYQTEAEMLNDYEIPPLKQTISEIRDEYDKGTILKAVENGRIIGSVRVCRENGTGFIGKLMVHPDYRKRGIGTALLRAAETACPSGRYELFTSDRSLNNIRLYEKSGYRRFKEKDAKPGLRFVYLEKSAGGADASLIAPKTL